MSMGYTGHGREERQNTMTMAVFGFFLLLVPKLQLGNTTVQKLQLRFP
jgi:hypothetical protein